MSNIEKKSSVEHAVATILAMRDVSQVSCYPLGPNHFMMEVSFKYPVISYECLSAVLHCLRQLLGQQSVSRFYSFSAGTLRVALTPEPQVRNPAELDFEDE